LYRPCQLRAEKVTVHFRKRALRDAFVARAFSFSATDISKILKKCTLLIRSGDCALDSQRRPCGSTQGRLRAAPAPEPASAQRPALAVPCATPAPPGLGAADATRAQTVPDATRHAPLDAPRPAWPSWPSWSSAWTYERADTRTAADGASSQSLLRHCDCSAGAPHAGRAHGDSLAASRCKLNTGLAGTHARSRA